MGLDAKNLILRATSGILYVALIVFTLVCKNPLYYTLLFSFFTGVMIIEYNLLTKENRTTPFRTTLDVLASVGMVWAFFFFYSGDENNQRIGFSLIIFYLFYLFYVIVRTIFSDINASAVRSIGSVLLGQLYITLPVVLSLFYIQHVGAFFVLFIFIILWVNDTSAYLVGSLLGRHKLYPAVSPKKSVEGLIGGLLLSVVIGGLMGYYAQEIGSAYLMNLENTRVGQSLFMAILALAIAVLGSLGDLFESVLKRQAKVKDSGHLIPGHGGVLDRLDSFLFAVYALVFLLLC
ncbi:MAG: phosphatidate cytidylyltransferase [Bacteroidales bacterium]|nr:phosphatidate cytidylyltransferase [Porphyromonas sp.]MDD6934375.1 phosphatidate cytidylyltransferase [Bacteroidales bacterium]